MDMRIAFSLVAVGIALFIACGGADDGTSRAIEAVVTSEVMGNGSYADHHEGDNECMIFGGGPPPGIRVPGTCCWEAEQESDDWIVSLTQIWRCEDFSAIINAKDTCPGETGSHTWRYRVNTKSWVSIIDDSGDFPPQSVP
jgi:hypothetical protein